jgi:hypothetical protein
MLERTIWITEAGKNLISDNNRKWWCGRIEYGLQRQEQTKRYENVRSDINPVDDDAESSDDDIAISRSRAPLGVIHPVGETKYEPADPPWKAPRLATHSASTASGSTRETDRAIAAPPMKRAKLNRDDDDSDAQPNSVLSSLPTYDDEESSDCPLGTYDPLPPKEKKAKKKGKKNPGPILSTREQQERDNNMLIEHLGLHTNAQLSNPGLEMVRAALDKTVSCSERATICQALMGAKENEAVTCRWSPSYEQVSSLATLSATCVGQMPEKFETEDRYKMYHGSHLLALIDIRRNKSRMRPASDQTEIFGCKIRDRPLCFYAEDMWVQFKVYNADENFNYKRGIDQYIWKKIRPVIGLRSKKSDYADSLYDRKVARGTLLFHQFAFWPENVQPCWIEFHIMEGPSVFHDGRDPTDPKNRTNGQMKKVREIISSVIWKPDNKGKLRARGLKRNAAYEPTWKTAGSPEFSRGYGGNAPPDGPRPPMRGPPSKAGSSTDIGCARTRRRAKSQPMERASSPVVEGTTPKNCMASHKSIPNARPNSIDHCLHNRLAFLAEQDRFNPELFDATDQDAGGQVAVGTFRNPMVFGAHITAQPARNWYFRHYGRYSLDLVRAKTDSTNRHRKIAVRQLAIIHYFEEMNDARVLSDEDFDNFMFSVSNDFEAIRDAELRARDRWNHWNRRDGRAVQPRGWSGVYALSRTKQKIVHAFSFD